MLERCEIRAEILSIKTGVKHLWCRLRCLTTILCPNWGKKLAKCRGKESWPCRQLIAKATQLVISSIDLSLCGSVRGWEPVAVCICTGVLPAFILFACGTMPSLSEVIKRPKLLSSYNQCPPVLLDRAGGHFLDNTHSHANMVSPPSFNLPLPPKPNPPSLSVGTKEAKSTSPGCLASLTTMHCTEICHLHRAHWPIKQIKYWREEGGSGRKVGAFHLNG